MRTDRDDNTPGVPTISQLNGYDPAGVQFCPMSADSGLTCMQELRPGYVRDVHEGILVGLFVLSGESEEYDVAFADTFQNTSRSSLNSISRILSLFRSCGSTGSTTLGGLPQTLQNFTGELVMAESQSSGLEEEATPVDSLLGGRRFPPITYESERVRDTSLPPLK